MDAPNKPNDEEDRWTVRQDAGDYTIELDMIADRGVAGVVSIELRGKKRDDGYQFTVSRDVLADVARLLPDLVNRAQAVRLATETIRLGGGTVTLKPVSEPDRGISVPVSDAAIQRFDPQAAQEHYNRLRAAERRRLTDDDLQLVADTYLAAKERGDSVMKAVSDVMAVSESRAGHLIKAARDAGLLPPSGRRRKK